MTIGLKIVLTFMLFAGICLAFFMFGLDPADGEVCLPLKIFCTNVQN